MITRYGDLLLRWFTYYFFVLIVLAIVISSLKMLPVFITLDWTNIQSFVEVLRVILFWVIGIEFARLLIEYKTQIIIELLIFVIARKLLLIENDMISVAIGVGVIVLLLTVWHKLSNQSSGNTKNINL